LLIAAKTFFTPHPDLLPQGEKGIIKRIPSFFLSLEERGTR